MAEPPIIQGGMGVAVSGWPLARAVSRQGQLGVVSGTALAVILARRLQLGDPGGELRRAIARFPFPAIAQRIQERFFVAGGKSPDGAFKLTPMPTLEFGPELLELTVLANFVEVYLAKEGHNGVVGINYLEKIQLPALPSLFGAMLAEVDYVLMGAGIPRAIPGVIDRFAQGEPATLNIDVEDSLPGEESVSRFDPAAFGGSAPKLKRPRFLGIVASSTLALTLARKASGRVDGFVVEGPTAGGHNAPPRGKVQLNASGEPLYGPRDIVELEKIRELGLPFWLAGSYGQPGKLAEALSLGAAGIQVGTAFAFCEESGIEPEMKHEVIRLSRLGLARVFTDPRASPTGFPFKVVLLPSAAGEADTAVPRSRICDLGYLRHVYRKPDGTAGYRCPAEPVDDFLEKGGSAEETEGRKCVCNSLAATAGYAQVRSGIKETPLLTAGDEVVHLYRFVPDSGNSYRASDVINHLLR
jgi:nitronate monooxygenase